LWGENIHPLQLRLAQQMAAVNNKKKYGGSSQILRLASRRWMTCVIDKTNKHIVDIGIHKKSPYILARFLTAPNETVAPTEFNAGFSINRVSKRILQGIDFAFR
jgi:hypothetical protein